MNVLYYFLGSPSFAEPAMIVHLADQDALDPAELAALMALWQNPTYPEDSYFTSDQFNAAARADSMQRAQSPGPLLCKLETADSITHPEHIHTYSECMDYRAHQDIAPSDPWIYWELFDDYLSGLLPQVIPPPVGPRGWTPLARVNPRGISEMNGWLTVYYPLTFVTQIGASQILTAGYGPGTQIRVIISAQAIFGSIYIGPATQTAFVASALHRLSFGGQNTNIHVDSTFSDGGPGMPFTRVSDPLTPSFDTPNGLIVCGYLSSVLPGYPIAAYLATKSSEQDWSARYQLGDHASDLDKSKVSNDPYKPGWVPGGTLSDFGVLMVEALY
jgi:hypothetical protein